MPTMPYSSASPTLKSAYVTAIRTAYQAKDRVIGSINGFLLSVEPEDWREGSEGLLSGARHGRVGICQNGGDKETLADLVPAYYHSYAFHDSILHMLLHLAKR
jgi:hypothetical protein